MRHLAARILLALAALVIGAPAYGQTSVTLNCYNASGSAINPCGNTTTPIVVSGTVTASNPSVGATGAAVPISATFDGVNVAGNLRGVTGLSLGSTFSPTVAIVDASGNQITTFGGAATTSNATSGVATSSTNQAAVTWNYGFNGTTWDQLQVDASKFLKVNVSAGTVAATQSGTWTVQPGNTANTTPWLATINQGGLSAGVKSQSTASTGTENVLNVMQPDGLAVSGTLAATGNLFSQDMLGYESITVQVTSAGTTCTITYETSDDNTNWVSAAGLISTSVGNTANATTSTTAIMLHFPRRGRYFRARVSTYTSGTVTVVGTFSKVPMNYSNFASVNSTVSVIGTINQGTAVSTSNLPGMVSAYSTNPAAISNAQYARSVGTLIGVQIQKPYSIPEADWSYVAATGGIANTTTAVTIVAAAAAGIRNYVTSCQLSSDPLGAATEFAIRDGAAGTVIWRMKIGTAGIVNGLQISWPSPIKSTAATLLEVVTLSASITGGVFVNCSGYQAP